MNLVEMNLNGWSVVAAILSVVGFMLAYRFAKQRAWTWRWLACAIGGLLALPGASFTLYYLHLTKEVAWYYEFRSWTGVELLVILCGVAGGLVAAILPRILLILPLLASTVLAIVPLLKSLIGPIPYQAFQEKWEHQVCLQSTPSTCGAASVATILRFFGKDRRESEVAKSAYSYTGGTEAWYLARVLRSQGLRAEFSFTRNFPGDDPLPAVVGVRLGAVGHFIPVLEKDGERYLIGDPLHGPEWLSREQLEQRYEFTGFRMLVSTAP